MFLSLVKRKVIGGVQTLYPNGYEHRLTAIAPVARLQLVGTTDPLVLRVTRTDVNLRSVSNGGFVISDLGWDIRCETSTDGKLAHEIDYYNPVSGTISLWVRFRNVLPDVSITLYLYFGKSGLAGSEADENACWAGFFCSTDLATGRDHSSTAMHLTLAGVTPTLLSNMRAGDFGQAALLADSYLTSTGDTWATNDGDTWGIV